MENKDWREEFGNWFSTNNIALKADIAGYVADWWINKITQALVEERESVKKELTEKVLRDVEKRYLKTNIIALVAEMKKDAEEYDLHSEGCGTEREDECDCENMLTIKSFASEHMSKVNHWWVTHAEAHRKHCTPDGNKMLTKMMGKKNRDKSIHQALAEDRERVREVIEKMYGKKWIIHERGCIENRRPCGAVEKPEELADRCYIQSYDKETLDNILSSLDKLTLTTPKEE